MFAADIFCQQHLRLIRRSSSGHVVEEEESTDGRLIGGKELLLWKFGL
jgi:hypothetical protein